MPSQEDTSPGNETIATTYRCVLLVTYLSADYTSHGGRDALVRREGWLSVAGQNTVDPYLLFGTRTMSPFAIMKKSIYFFLLQQKKKNKKRSRWKHEM